MALETRFFGRCDSVRLVRWFGDSAKAFPHATGHFQRLDVVLKIGSEEQKLILDTGDGFIILNCKISGVGQTLQH
jgi:hypothetical protein